MTSTKSKTSPKKPTHSTRKNGFAKLNRNFDKSLEAMLDAYFRTLSNYKADNLHRLVLSRVEKKLLEYVLRTTDSNQARAAEILGISRGTLRSKIRTSGVALKKTRLPSDT